MPDFEMGVDAREEVRRFLQQDTGQLLGIIRSYVMRLGLVTAEHAQAAAIEVFQDAVLEALAHADRFDRSRHAQAWFLGIAATILKRKRSSLARRYRFEALTSELTNDADGSDDENFFDRFTQHIFAAPEQEFEAEEYVQDMLALVPAADAEVLRMAVLQELDAKEMAARLGVTVGAARVRLHRALRRLRAAWKQEQES